MANRECVGASSQREWLRCGQGMTLPDSLDPPSLGSHKVTTHRLLTFFVVLISTFGSRDASPNASEALSEYLSCLQSNHVEGAGPDDVCLAAQDSAAEFKAVLNSIANDDNRKITVKEGECAATPSGYVAPACYDGNEHFFNDKSLVTMNRDEIMKRAVQMQGSGTSAQAITEQKKLYLKLYANIYVHELCHAKGDLTPAEHPGYNDGEPIDDAYWNTAVGSCERFSFQGLFGQAAPMYRSQKKIKQTYDLPKQCLLDIWNKPADKLYIDSVRSAIAARTQTPPNYIINWTTGPNPH